MMMNDKVSDWDFSDINDEKKMSFITISWMKMFEYVTRYKQEKSKGKVLYSKIHIVFFFIKSNYFWLIDVWHTYFHSSVNAIQILWYDGCVCLFFVFFLNWFFFTTKKIVFNKIHQRWRRSAKLSHYESL